MAARRTEEGGVRIDMTLQVTLPHADGQNSVFDHRSDVTFKERLGGAPGRSWGQRAVVGGKGEVLK